MVQGAAWNRSVEGQQVKRSVVIAGAVVLLIIVASAVVARTLRYGFSAHDQPTRIEAWIARTMRQYSVPADLRDVKNPVPPRPEILAEARAHFADHCASCHGNDGKGLTQIGRRFYPKAPDMTMPDTQKRTDGELFATIENGIRLTAMPGWGEGTAASAYGSWSLVHFIRHLPRITPGEIAEMEKLNPKSPEEWQEMQVESEFLNADEAGDSKPTATTTQHHH